MDFSQSSDILLLYKRVYGIKEKSSGALRRRRSDSNGGMKMEKNRGELREKTVQENGMKKKKKIWKILGLTLTALVLACLAGGFVYVFSVISRAPDLDVLDVEPEGYRSSVLNTDEEVVLTLSGEASNRVYVKLSEVPEDLQHAFVAIEDERFYKHHGIDLKGIVRAFFKGIANGGHFSQGASTITQQLLKNNVFSAWTQESSFSEKLERKIQEQYLAVRLERKVSKEWILENYLNTINLGGGNWGVQTAAKYYFDKDVSELTLAECAVLAGITKNPTTYNPVKNPEKNAERQKLVLANMTEQGFITEEQQQEALKEDVYGRIEEVRANGVTQQIMTYFEEAMLYQVLDDLQEATGCTEEQAWDRIYRGGLTIYSTEDSRLQKIAERAVNEADVPAKNTQMSLVMIDNETGQVRAMVGGRGKKEANLILNRATSSLRQPGSTVKVIGAYALGIENGRFTLGSVYDDAPTAYSDGTVVHNANGEYLGKMTVHEAITTSCNTVAVQTFSGLGIRQVMADLELFGITTLTDQDRVESLALGGTSGGVTNLEMTAAYSVLARGGEYLQPVYYTKILDQNGDVLIEKTAAARDVVKTETAVLLTAAMEDVLKKGTGKAASFEGMSLAGKTGTTTGSRDVWMIGYSPYLTCGVWGGQDDNGKQEDGTYVKEAWRQAMSEAHKGKSDPGFDGVGSLVQVKICTKCGKRAVEGLCDCVNVQGSDQTVDHTMTEYYVSGQEPQDSCTCHKEITVCRESRQLPNRYCDDTWRMVFLREAAEDTEDAACLQPEDVGQRTCSVHKPTFSIPWFSGDGWGENNNNNGQNDGGQNDGSQNDGSQDNGWGSGQDGGSQDNGWGSNDQNDGHQNNNQDDDQDDGGHWWDIFFR